MTNISPIAVLIVAAGSGERFGASVPKQYLPLLGRPVLRWSIDLFRAHPAIGDIFVAIGAGHEAQFNAAIAGIENVKHLTGGATRQETVRLALDAIAKTTKPEFILIHDAARPGLTADLVTRLCDEVQRAEAVIPGVAIADTVKRLSGDNVKTESRDGLYAIQTPQAFAFAPLLAAHTVHAGQALTDDAALFEADGRAVKIIPGEKGNFKVTHGEDLGLMEQSLAARCGDIRTGTGYDVHRLVPPKHDLHRMKICGVEIAHPLVLEGHSDADVGLHAITDAILGAICDGDIGMHFSPRDARWKNADSAKFLAHAAGLVTAQGGMVTHVDVTVICEEPKIGPHRDAMRARIADILSLPPSRISVKATTTEGLGFTGRKEGIAAEAAVTIRLPFGAGENIESGGARKWGT